MFDALTTDGILDMPAFLAMSSVVLHAIGYGLYIRLSLAREVEPNPLTWLMFSYGTTLLTVIEHESGATWRELALPVTCSAGSLVVAAICALRGCLRLPQSRLEIAAFAADVALTVAYVTSWWGSQNVALSHGDRTLLDLCFLVASNATTLTAFVPILASTRLRPEDERGLPWVVWTAAYAALLVATLASIKGYENASLLIYPLSNLILHGVVALLALTGVWAIHERTKSDLYVGETPHTGRGLFARRAFARGELVFAMTGKRRRYQIRTAEESTRFENWLGIGLDLYLIPDKPYIFANHSCVPNLGVRGQADFVALRDIAPDEELTFDYAITTDELTWRMPCRCGQPTCRREISGIQSLPPEIVARYLPFISTYFQAVYREASGKEDKLSAQQLH